MTSTEPAPAQPSGPAHTQAIRLLAGNDQADGRVEAGANSLSIGGRLQEAIEHADGNGVAVHTAALSREANLTALAELAASTGGSLTSTSDAPRLVSCYGGVGRLLSGSEAFYRTTWRLSIVGGNVTLSSGYWIRATVAIDTPGGTLYVPFRLAFD